MMAKDKIAEFRRPSYRIEFSEDEIELLAKICKKHRASLPIYLESTRAELALIDKVTGKLG